MFVLQIRSVRHRANPRCHLCFARKYCQWKTLHLRLVLVGELFPRTAIFRHLTLFHFLLFLLSKVILAVLSVFSIMYHIFLMITPSMVRMILRSRSLHQSDLPLEEMGKHFELGDWKLLYILSRNMEPLVFGEFIRELYKVLKEIRGKNATSAKQPFVVKGLKNDPWWWCRTLFLTFKVIFLVCKGPNKASCQYFHLKRRWHLNQKFW